MGAAECKGCSTSDPTSDTVKVNPTLLTEETAAEKEKSSLAEEQQFQQETEERQAREAAAEEERLKRLAEEEETRRRQEEAAEQERLERERAAERERLAREEAERIAAHEREAQERAAAEEAARRAKEEEEEKARHAEELRLAAELDTAKNKVAIFLKARGFAKGIAVPKKGCMKTSYPLHVAVEENSADMVAALLLCGADKKAKNSAGLTPLELAQKLHKKKGSHSAVIAALA